MSALIPTLPPGSTSVRPSLAQLVAFLRFLMVAALSKGLALIHGFLVVWLLDLSAYGIYAAVIAMATTVAGMGNAGIGMFISAFGGRHHADAIRFGSLITAAGAVQNVLLAGCGVIILIALPIQCVALEITAIPGVILLTVLGAATMATAVRSMMQQEALKICLRVELVQYVDTTLSLLRITATLGLYGSGHLDAISLVAANLLINLISLIVQRGFIRQLTRPGAAPTQVAEDRRAAWEVVLPQLPNAIYSAFQGQIPYWLMSLFTSLRTIAEFTALGRLSLLLGFLFDVVSGYFIPRVGRCQDPSSLGRLIVVILSTFYLVEAAILIVAYVFRHHLLWLLGPQYAHLEAQLVLILLSIGFGSVSASLHAINASRAWLKHSWSFIILTVGTQALSLCILDVSTLSGLLWFGILPHIPFIVINLMFMRRGLDHFRRMNAANGSKP